MSLSAPADLANYLDISVIRTLAVDGNAQLSREDVLALPILQTFLDSAFGRILTAIQFSTRYTQADLESLTDDSANHVKMIECKLAIISLMWRRPGSFEREREFLKNETQEFLRALQDGKEVLTLEPQLESGLVDHADSTNSDALITQHSPIARRLEGHLFTRY